ncbi:actin gamma [Biomphalaria pfeifferi]|uniref:Actin gamma n=1 Tax=Biomphalaria pfeifferi TaxID=112525 RepID=A0AAD8FGV5_BIOPF|nr:actin gamma [Biomphalaria pfeifferi]
MSGDEPVPAIVVDNGSDSCKVGLAREDLPASVFPSTVARDANKVSFVGQKAIDRISDLELHYPIKRGLITNWDDMEVLWAFMFKDALSVDPSKHPVLMSEALNNSSFNREKTAQILFEKFQIPSLFMTNQAVLSLYHAGRVTGTIVDIGAGATSVVPIYEGFNIGEASVKVDLAGSDITEYLIRLLKDKGHNLTSPPNKLIAKKIKETLCLVSQKEQVSSAPSTFELPDKNVIILDTERYKSTEILFDPELSGRGDIKGVHKLAKDTPHPHLSTLLTYKSTEILFDPELSGRGDIKGVHKLVNGAISSCDMNVRKPLYTNILLSGGTSLFEGLANRLQHELTSLNPQNPQAKVHARRDRHLAAWIGGSVFAALPTFQQLQITKKEYQEAGPSIIKRKWP